MYNTIQEVNLYCLTCGLCNVSLLYWNYNMILSLSFILVFKPHYDSCVLFISIKGGCLLGIENSSTAICWYCSKDLS